MVIVLLAVLLLGDLIGTGAFDDMNILEPKKVSVVTGSCLLLVIVIGIFNPSSPPVRSSACSEYFLLIENLLVSCEIGCCCVWCCCCCCCC